MSEPVNCTEQELCTYLAALEEGYLATSCLDITPCVQSRLTPIASKSYQHGKKTVSFRDFDGAVNLLAELENPQLFSEFSEALKTCRITPPEIWIEIVIKAIACAYKIPTPQRFALLDSFSPVGRMIKAGIIDAMLIIADPNDQDTLNLIRDKVASFLSDHDQYIVHYAQEALDDLP